MEPDTAGDMKTNPLYASRIDLNEFPALKSSLNKFDCDQNGFLDQAEIGKMIAAYAETKESSLRNAIPISSMPARFQKTLEVFDSDGSGWIEGDELAHAASLYAESKKSVKRLCRLVVVLLFVLLVLVGTIVGLTAVVIEEMKETKTRVDGFTTVKGSSAPAATGSISTKASIYGVVDFTPQQLHQIKTLDFVLANGNKVGYTVSSYYQNSARIDKLVTFWSASGAKIMVSAQLVTVVDDKNDVHFSETPQATSNRRRRSLLTEDANTCLLCVEMPVNLPVEEASDSTATSFDPYTTLYPWDVISLHNQTAADCWVVIHDQVVDVTHYTQDLDERGVYLCGTDVTFIFTNNHGNGTDVLNDWIAANPLVELQGSASPTARQTLESTSSSSSSDDAAAATDTSSNGAFDLSGVVRQPHPGNGREFKTLIYMELFGGLDSSAVFVNVETEEEIHTWCSKRPTLSAEPYCECLSTTTEEIEETGTQIEVCSQYVLSNATDKQTLHPLATTNGFLAMAEPYANDPSDASSKSWLHLWDAGEMALVPGVGRRDHARSHFEVKDAAAKGVTTLEEDATQHGWLATSIALSNSLYCQRDESVEACRNTRDRTRMVDGISLRNAAAGPNAMEASDSSLDPSTFLHISGVNNLDSVSDAQLVDYVDPFANDGEGDDDIDDDFINPALSDLLQMEEVIFQGLGVVKSQLTDYMDTVVERCPDFPDVTEWAVSMSRSDNHIGMQLRAAAILIINDVQPKVFQLQYGNFDTHSDQAERLGELLQDVRIGVYTFVETAQNCGFWDDTLLVIFSEFGRRIAENSRKGTDHGWGQTITMFGSDLTKQVYGYDAVTNSSELEDIVPSYVSSFAVPEIRGDLEMTTDVETFNACLLDAMALPALSRLGTCPPEMRFRDGLPDIPMFQEEGHRIGGGGDDTEGSGLSEIGDGSHLTAPLSHSQRVHVARRVGDSIRSLDHVLDSYGGDVTLQNVITEVLSDDSLAYRAHPEDKVYSAWEERANQGIALWSRKRREERNVWDDILHMVYPRVETFERRVKRWDMEKMFNMSSLWMNEEEERFSTVSVSDAYLGREGEILAALQEEATVFFPGYPVKTGSFSGAGRPHNVLGALRLIDEESGEITVPAPDVVDWYQTVMRTPDVKTIVNLTVEQVLEDRRCDAATATHPSDPTLPCDPACDLAPFLILDLASQTAFLNDTRGWTETGAAWRTLRACTSVWSDRERRRWENERNKEVRVAIGHEMYDEMHADVTDPRAGLRARMTWFFRNVHATPLTTLQYNYALMQAQYAKLWKNALGNYRDVAFEMFNDKALRLSLDQLEEVECGTPPVENFAREYLERFTVGLEGHNEGDVKKLAKALTNCVKDYETGADFDLRTVGVIFHDVNQTVWTETTQEQRSVVNRVLDFKMDASEPPVAAQVLCSKLYKEFAVPPAEVAANLSSVLMPPEVVECATALHQNDYEIKFALDHIFKDKVNFYDTLGKKARWPKSVLYGAWTDLDLDLNQNQARNWAAAVGQEPFEPQDVSGDDLDNVWTTTRLSEARDFFSKPTLREVIKDFDRNMFADRETMEAALAAYQLPDHPELYSLAVQLCAVELFVNQEGAVGNHIINATTLFDNSIRATRGIHRKWKVWREAVTLAITNVCQYVE